MKKIFLLSVVIGSLFASNIVKILPFDNYPIPTCQTIEKNKKQYYLIPYETKAKVIKWDSSITKGSKKFFFAKIDMMNPVYVQIINGPLKGKKCRVDYFYIHLIK